jgi:hypothetical protein
MKTAENRQPVHIGKVVRNARIFNFRNPRGGSLSDSALLEAVARLFALLEERRIDYLLAGDIALLQYVEGRNTEDIYLIMSLSSLERLPELRKVGKEEDDFVRADFAGLQIDLLLISNPLFDEVHRRYATRQNFAEREIPCAAPEGLVLLKLYALPSLYRQGNVTRAALYDILTLMSVRGVDPEPLFAELEPHVSATDLKALRQIVAEIRQRLANSGRFEPLA